MRTTTPIAVLCLLASCSGGDPEPTPDSGRPKLTNRLSVPPEVLANLGITFEKATRGKVGVWINVPGELYVPSTHRWSLRAPVRGLVKDVVPLWTNVEPGDVVVKLVSPEVMKQQQMIYSAQSEAAVAESVYEAAAARLAEAEIQLREAREVEMACRAQAKKLRDIGGAVSAKQLLEAQQRCSEGAGAALDAAVRRDELKAKAREKDVARKQAALRVTQEVSGLSVLTGWPVKDLLREDGWKKLDGIEMRAPAGGTVVNVPVSRGLTVERGASLAILLDPVELRFRGWVPESDLNVLRSGVPLRIELPGDMDPVKSRLLGPMPVADSATRRLQVEAVVPNPKRLLPEGLSATAFVQVQESVHEEVLLSEECIVQDGLETIVFRRDPNDLDTVIRTPVELGLRGAGQVEILSGVLDGDMVVRDGIFQLKQTGLGKAPQGGHFHVDGTWHKDHK